MPAQPAESRNLRLPLCTALAGAAVFLAFLPLTGTSAASSTPQVQAAPAAAALPTPEDETARPQPVTAAPAADGLSQLLEAQRAAGLDCTATEHGLPLCVHGNDTPLPGQGPDGHAHAPGTPDHSHDTAEGTGSGSSTGTASKVGCYGDGTSGPRVRAVYARPDNAKDGYAAALPSIRSWAAGVSAQFDASAQRTGGRRHVRFATTPGPSCSLLVQHVVLPADAFTSFRATVEALEARGLDAPYSKYLVWADAKGYCGIASTYADDRPGLDNLNNGALPGYARVDRRCWGKVETHEVVHMLGGVQHSARNSTGGYHCNDGRDVMCYDDGTASAKQRAVCPKEHAHLLDCRNDDYFSTAPAKGSYLDKHWNTARSSFLAATLSEPTAAASPSPSSSPSPSRPSPSPSPSSSPSREPIVVDAGAVLAQLPTPPAVPPVPVAAAPLPATPVVAPSPVPTSAPAVLSAVTG